ncbi:EAL domain-containing protein [Sphingosinicella rhizophila]|uniref:EAL domain-containing protein n=1 Tax=Sphingosinicella rhizophila TaxID=3050082 RepID=A0ABU3Q1Z9_9SPHN|nr:EAL domain-containing protein [Sphingosinicella sp. GR2756]MDT9597446.1 EAL domain-containing protein [Sphingosinicella sp. GR2756]
MKIVPAREAAAAAELQLAAERQELFLLYQPKIDLVTGGLAGVEALLRWESPAFGLMKPSEFIPIAERSGAIDSLTDWGVRQVIRQWLDWREQGFKINIAYNISALTLRDVHFPDYLQRLCQIEGMPCEELTLEVTEGATQHAIRLLDTLTRFRIKGMSLALDDFGTGYSSLLQLRQLPYTELKIDRCFIRDVADDPEARLIVRSIIDLAHGLGLVATAEGVETEEMFEFLVDLGCDQAQGFLMARPMRAQDLAPWILNSQTHWREQCKRPALHACQLAVA